MSAKFLGGVLGFALLICTQTAQAQRVVVLEFHGDKGNKVRAQVERALRRNRHLQIQDLRRYRIAAAKKRFKGSKAMTPGAVAAVSRSLGLTAAVAGAAGKVLRVQVVDGSGAEIWKKEIPLRRGQLSSDNARRIAVAVAAAVGVKTPEPAPPPPPPPRSDARPPEVQPVPEAHEPEKGAGQPPPPVDVSSKPETPEDREKRKSEELAEAHTTTDQPRDSDLDLEMKKSRARVGPKLFTAQVTGTTTWRSYCSRPGVNACSQYNLLDASQRPPGDTVDFKAEVPYVGFALAVEYFPFARVNNLTKGIGLLAGYDRGFSLTNVRVQTTPPTDTAGRQVYSSDQGIKALATYRYFFGLGDKAEPLVGYAGLRAGYTSRTFDVDQNAGTPLPGSHRHHATIALEGLYPVAKFLKFLASGSYFLGAKPSTSEINDYGTSSSSKGWGIEAGAAGDVWGPFGYVLTVKLSKYSDQFSGAGTKWQSGGAAEESYFNLYWGASAHF